MKQIIITTILVAIAISGVYGQKANRKPKPMPRQRPTATSTEAPKTSSITGFRIGIKVMDSHKTTIGGGAQFGIDTGATFCVDAKLGESYLPPNPPAGLPDLRFANPRGKHDDCFDLGINNDYRPYRNAEQSDTFKVLFQAPADGYPITVSWDALATHFKGDVTLRSPLSGKALNVDMKKETTATLTEDFTAFYIIASKPVITAKKK